jgi:hypothetical protein
MLSRFATLGGAPTDPYWANVSYLLVGNGTNGTTTNIKDSSSNNLATTVVGGAVISTAQNKYGSGSLYVGGSSGDYVTFASSAGLSLTGDFTIEFWANPASLTNATYPIVLGSGATSWGGGCVGINFHGSAGTQGKLVMFTYETSGTPIVGSTTLAVVGNWYYYAITRSGSTVKLYVNGSLESTGTATQTFAFNTTKTFIGANGWDPLSTSQFKGYIYDLRVTKGVARTITSSPSGPFPTQGP